MKQHSLRQHVFCLTANNENGSAILIAMLMLVVLTLIGISATNTSTTELKIASNEKIYKQNFNRAEAAIQEALKILKDTPLKQRGSLTWVKAVIDPHEDAFDMDDVSTWDADPTSSTQNALMCSYIGSGLDRPLFTAGMVPVGSISMNQSILYQYTVLGLSTSNNGKVLIRIGFRQRQ